MSKTENHALFVASVGDKNDDVSETGFMQSLDNENENSELVFFSTYEADKSNFFTPKTNVPSKIRRKKFTQKGVQFSQSIFLYLL